MFILAAAMSLGDFWNEIKMLGLPSREKSPGKKNFVEDNLDISDFILSSTESVKFFPTCLSGRIPGE